MLDDASFDLVVDAQVLNEFYGTVTRRLSPRVPEDVAHDVVHRLCEWDVVPVDAGFLDAASSRRWTMASLEALGVAQRARERVPDWVVVDTSAWVAFFRGSTPGRAEDFLR